MDANAIKKPQNHYSVPVDVAALDKGFFFLWTRDLEQLKVRGGVRRVQCLVPLTSREKDTQRPADFHEIWFGFITFTAPD